MPKIIRSIHSWGSWVAQGRGAAGVCSVPAWGRRSGLRHFWTICPEVVVKVKLVFVHDEPQRRRMGSCGASWPALTVCGQRTAPPLAAGQSLRPVEVCGGEGGTVE